MVDQQFEKVCNYEKVIAFVAYCLGFLSTQCIAASSRLPTYTYNIYLQPETCIPPTSLEQLPTHLPPLPSHCTKLQNLNSPRSRNEALSYVLDETFAPRKDMCRRK